MSWGDLLFCALSVFAWQWRERQYARSFARLSAFLEARRARHAETSVAIDELLTTLSEREARCAHVEERANAWCAFAGALNDASRGRVSEADLRDALTRRGFVLVDGVVRRPTLAEVN